MARARFVLFLVCLASAALGAPGADAPPGGGGEPTARRLEKDVQGDVTSPQRGLVPTVDIEGKVLDAAGRPLVGVLVKAFADGVLSGSARSDDDGSFRLSASLVERSGKGSAVLWFQSPHSEHLDGQVVLWAGEVAKAEGLFPP
ncbi:MAG: carboxypeptidase-like regulatory domain-containing protein, partial [Actinobacteria bacterium]|nr:carboxypeptidase-like regulatory domain-containing protein [Actinomycetota bacterium]